MQNEICVVKSFFHHILECAKEGSYIINTNLRIENIVPQVLTKIYDMSYNNSKTLMENILSASKCK